MKAVAVVIVLLGVVGAGGAAYRSRSSCVVGVRGTRASMTVRGFTAASRCKELVAANSDYYLRTAPVTEPVLCEGDRDGYHLTVHDEGALVLVGRVLCNSYTSEQPEATR